MLNTSFQLRTIGNLLKERRKERKLNIGQIAEITKIRREYLEAIEESNYDIFPSEVYLKGFLKNYAKFLGVNTERAVAMYRREREYKKGDPVISSAEKVQDKTINLTITPGRIIGLGLLIALILAVGYIGSYIGRVLREPELRILAPVPVEAGTEESLRVSDTNVLVEGEVEVGSTLSVNGQEYETNNFKKFSEQFELQPGLNTFVLVAESEFGRRSELTFNVFREGAAQDTATDDTDGEVAGATSTPTPSPTPGAEEFLTGVITIVDREAYLEVTEDDTLTVGRVLQVGETIDFNEITFLKIVTPRPDAVQIEVNGEADLMNGTTTTWEIINGELTKL